MYQRLPAAVDGRRAGLSSLRLSGAAIGITLALAGCAVRAPLPSVPDLPAASEAATTTWSRRIEPRFTPYLEGSYPALRHGLHLSIVDAVEPMAPCVAPAGEMRVSTALIDALRLLAAATAFAAARPEHASDLMRYMRHVRAARFAGGGSAPPLAFDVFAGVGAESFARVLREPGVAALRAFIERDTLGVILAQRIGLLAATASGHRSCSRAQQAQADAFAFDLVQATRRTPAHGQFPVFALFVVLDTDPGAAPAQSRSLECRAAYFAGRELAATAPGTPVALRDDPRADQAALSLLAARRASADWPC